MIQKTNILIIDPGASNHMTSQLRLLSNIQKVLDESYVTLPNGYKYQVTYSGSLKIGQNMELTNVLFIPEF